MIRPLVSMRVLTRLSTFSLLLSLTITCGCSADGQVNLGQSQGPLRLDNPKRGLWDGYDRVPLSFSLEQVYGAENAPRSAVLGSIADVALDDDANLYLLDYVSTRLVAFDPRGDVLWTAGRRGDGPGEFSDPSFLTFDGDSTLYITNRNATAIDLWTTTGRYLETRSLYRYGIESSASVVGFIQPNHLVLVGRLPHGLGSRVSIIDVSKRGTEALVIRFDVEAGPFEEPIAQPVGPPIDVRTQGNLIFTGNLGTYSLSVFDSSAKPQVIITRPVDYLRLPAVATIGRRSYGRTFGELSAPLVLENGFWLVQASWPTNVDDPEQAVQRIMMDSNFDIEWAHSLDLFDADGRFLASLIEPGRVPDIGTLVEVDGSGRIYTILNDPFPQARRYWVEFNPR